jgi:hypothetical protein
MLRRGNGAHGRLTRRQLLATGALAMGAAYAPSLEQWVLRTFDGSWAGTRIEWSKAWAFTGERPMRTTAFWATSSPLRHRSVARIARIGTGL